MFNRKFIGIFLILVMLLICVSAVSATDSETDDMKLAEIPEEIQTTDNEEVLNAGESLQDEINNDDDGLIEIEGTYNQSLSIHKNITIRGTGTGATFDGENTNRTIIKTLSNTNVHLENLLFTNTNGTVLIKNWGTLFLKNCTFTNHINFDMIIDCRGNLVVDSCKFLNNNASESGSVIAGYNNGLNYTISNCVFQTNHNKFSKDLEILYGEVHIEDMDMNMIERTKFSVCSMYFSRCNITGYHPFNRDCSYDNCTLINSRIYLPRESLHNIRFINSEINQQSVLNENITISGCEFINSSIVFSFEKDCSNVTIENTNFTNISSTAISFGYFYYGPWKHCLVNGFYLKNCNFNDYERAVYCEAINSSILNCTFVNGRGYAVKFDLNDTGIIDGCSFINMTSREGIILWEGPSRPAGYQTKDDGDGRVIGYENTSAKYSLKGSLTNSKFENIRAGSVLSTAVSDFSMEKCSFKNIAGKVSFGGFNTTATVADCMFDTWMWTMLSSYSIKTNIINTTFTNGNGPAVELLFAEFITKDSAGNYVWTHDFIMMQNCTFSNINTIEENSDTHLMVILKADGLISDCEFINNTGSKQLIAFSNYTGTLTQCAFINNTVEDGCLIFCEKMPKEISNCTFTGNTLQRNDIPIEGYIYFTCQQTGSYPGEIYLKITLYDKHSNKPIPNAEFKIDRDSLKTSADGSVSYKVPSGKTGSSVRLIRGAHSETHPITIKKRGSILIEYQEMSYASSTKLTIKLKDGNKKVVSNVAITIKVTVGKTVKTITARTDKNGIAKFSVSKLGAGTHKFTVSAITNYGVKAVTSKLHINKANPLIKAPKVKFKVKKSKYFKVKAIMNSKGIKDLKLKLKIGKKTYTVKTDKSGVAKLNTKKLKVGKHKVIITSGNPNYKINSKSQITIKR